MQPLLRNREGVAYLEFAMVAPMLFLLFLGSVELTRYIVIAQKVEKASMSVSDLVAQSENISTAQLNQLILAAGQLMNPYDFGSTGYVVVSSVSKTGANPPVINWQYANGQLARGSRVGSTGGTAILPNGLTLNDRDTVIIAEVFYSYQPMLVNDVFRPTEVYRISVFKPRLGDLRTLGA